MKKLFLQWRRKPFKEALCQAYSEGVINSKQLHILAWKFDNLNENLLYSLGSKPLADKPSIGGWEQSCGFNSKLP